MVVEKSRRNGSHHDQIHTGVYLQYHRPHACVETHRACHMPLSRTLVATTHSPDCSAEQAIPRRQARTIISQNSNSSSHNVNPKSSHTSIAQHRIPKHEIHKVSIGAPFKPEDHAHPDGDHSSRGRHRRSPGGHSPRRGQMFVTFA